MAGGHLVSSLSASNRSRSSYSPYPIASSRRASQRDSNNSRHSGNMIPPSTTSSQQSYQFPIPDPPYIMDTIANGIFDFFVFCYADNMFYHHEASVYSARLRMHAIAAYNKSQERSRNRDLASDELSKIHRFSFQFIF